MGPPSLASFWTDLIRATQAAGTKAAKLVGAGGAQSEGERPRGKGVAEEDPTVTVTNAAIREQTKDKAHLRRMRLFLAGATVVTFWGELYAMYRLLWAQGQGKDGFKLNDWLIGSVADGIIVQIILVLIIIAADLYPRGSKKVPGAKKGE